MMTVVPAGASLDGGTGVGEQTLRAVGMRIGLAYLSGPMVVVAVAPSPHSVGAGFAVLPALAAYAIAIVGCCRRPDNPIHRWALLGCCLVSTVAIWLLLGDSTRGAPDFAATWVVTAAASAGALAVGPAYGFGVLVAAQLSSVVGALTVGATFVPSDASGPLINWAICSVVSVFVRRGFRVTEQALKASAAARVRLEVVRRRWAAHRESDRVLHDTVLATLTMIAHGGAGIPVERLGDACRDDAELLRGGSRPVVVRPDQQVGVLVSAIQAEVVSAKQRGLRVAVHHSGAPARLGMQRQAALISALRECLANVVCHAGVSDADVVVHESPGGARVVVVDRGVGFDPDSVPGDRLGLSWSVHERLAEVGGSATVWSRPGSGTSVLLKLPRASDVEAVV